MGIQIMKLIDAVHNFANTPTNVYSIRLPLIGTIILHFEKLILLPILSVGNLFGIGIVEEMFVRCVECEEQVGVIVVTVEHASKSRVGVNIGKWCYLCVLVGQ